MKLHHLLGAAAAAALITGVAHAQSSGSATSSPPSGSDTTAGASGSMSSGTTSGTTNPAVTSAGSEPGAVNPPSQNNPPSAMPPATTDTTSGATSSMSSSSTQATSAGTYGQGASVTTTMTTNGPVPDTAENRQKYGGPMSRAGKRTAAKGN